MEGRGWSHRPAVRPNFGLQLAIPVGQKREAIGYVLLTLYLSCEVRSHSVWESADG
jgi:hypothetical protein